MVFTRDVGFVSRTLERCESLGKVLPAEGVFLGCDSYSSLPF